MAGPTLLELGVALAAVAVAATLATRVRVSLIPAFILAGIVVGPSPPTSLLGVSLTLVSPGEFLTVAAELGVVFLLFFLGLEFSVARLLADRRRIAIVGLLDLAVNAPIGFGLAVGFGLSPLSALFVAGIVYISSSAIVTRTLLDTGWIANPEADPVLGTLVFEDLVVAVLLAVLTALVAGATGPVAAGLDVARALLFLGALALVAYAGADLLQRVFSSPADEVMLLQVVGALTLVAGAALLAGASEAVAAFFVGAGLGGGAVAERLERLLAPLRDLFAALFFFTIGLATDLTLIAGVWPLLATAVVATVLAKLVTGTLAGRFYGLSGVRSARAGLALLPRGEFSLVLAALAVSAGDAVSGVVPAFAVAYVFVTSVLGALLVSRADDLVSRLVWLMPARWA